MNSEELENCAQFSIKSHDEMVRLGASWSKYVSSGTCMHFQGQLGAGKTTLIQGILQGLDVAQPVLSPTFSIMETYRCPQGINLLHIDLYRIEDRRELFLIGLDEFEKDDYAWMIEWPQRGEGVIPKPDFRTTINYAGQSRIITVNSRCEIDSEI